MDTVQILITQLSEQVALQVKTQVTAQLQSLLGDFVPTTPDSKTGRPRGRPATLPSRRELDKQDQKILTLLEKPLSVEKLSKKLGKSLSTTHRRISRLKTEKRLKGVREGNTVMYVIAPRRGPQAAGKPARMTRQPSKKRSRKKPGKRRGKKS